ncbi:hypothetical protein H3C66_02925 [Patescibacteria group bacterium]|nr:hypothetical protein [Patescibacteria group bacterium]
MDSYTIEVKAFGFPQVSVNGKRVKWRGKLAPKLFFFLTDKEAATRDEIFSAFWPHLGVKDATNVFHVTKRQLKEALEQAGLPADEFLKYSQGYYEMPHWKARPKPSATNMIVRYDVAAFKRRTEQYILDQESVGLEEWAKLFESVSRGVYMAGIEEEWFKQRRAEVRTTIAQAYVSAAHLALGKSLTPLATVWLEEAYKHQPLREDVHRELLSLYASVGNSKVAEFYAAVVKQLGTPSPETTLLYQQLM